MRDRRDILDNGDIEIQQPAKHAGRLPGQSLGP